MVHRRDEIIYRLQVVQPESMAPDSADTGTFFRVSRTGWAYDNGRLIPECWTVIESGAANGCFPQAGNSMTIIGNLKDG